MLLARHQVNSVRSIRFLAKLYCLLSNMAGVDRIMSFADRDEPEKHLGRPAAEVGG